MKKILLLILFGFTFSQKGYIEGIVLSENADTLAGANIYIDGTDIGTACNLYGRFSLDNLEPGKYIVKVNYIGHKEKSKTFYISAYSSNQEDDNNKLLLEKMGIESDSDNNNLSKAPFHENVKFILDADPLGIEEITVAASKVKQKITEAPSVVAVVNERALRRHVGVDNYNRLASFVKGVDITYFGIQGAQINARGFDGAYSTRFRQYEDGIYLGELVTGQVYSQIVGPPKESISKIEVLFGPQSALYGPDATQGLLNIIKKHPRENNDNEINISANNLGKYRVGGRLSRLYDKLAFDMVFEAATAKELAYGNTTGENNPIYYATDENDDEDYDDIACPSGSTHAYASPEENDQWPSTCQDANGIQLIGNPESDTLRSDYYGEMDQKRISLRSNFYYKLPNNAELSLSIRNMYGTGYAMGSVGPMYTISNNTNTISTKFISNRHSLRYTLLSQSQSNIPRQNLARFEVQNPDLNWDDAIKEFDSDTMFWNLDLSSLDHFIDYQWNTNLSSKLQVIAGFDYEYKDPNTNRTAIADDGYDYFARNNQGEDIKESKYGIYGQIITNFSSNINITASLRYDDHEYYGEMVSPRFAIVKDDFLNGSLKLIAGKGFKAPTILERNLYSGIVDAATGTVPYGWKIQGIAYGNNTGFTKYDFYDVGNGQYDQWIDLNGNGEVDLDQDLFEPYIDANYGIVGPGNAIESADICGAIGGTYHPTYNTCGNGVYDFIDLNQNGLKDEDESYELYWELDGDGVYGPGDILIDSTYIQPLKVEEFTSYEISYVGMIDKNTLININAYYGIYENFKSSLKYQGITGPSFLNEDIATVYPFSIRQINRGNEILGGHFLADPDQYIYTQTYESMPIEINYIGFDFGLKHLQEKFELAANFSYFDDSDLNDKREKAEKYNSDPVTYNSFEKYKNFAGVYSNTSNFKYNTTLTLIEPILNNLNVSIMLKGNTPYDFVSGVFQATKAGKGQQYDPVEGYKIDGGQVGGGIYIDLNFDYTLNKNINIGFGIKNLLESSTVSFPMTPTIPRSFTFETGYKL